MAEILTIKVQLSNIEGPNGRLEPLIEIFHGVETLRINSPEVNVTVTDATLKLCRERGIANVDVRDGAEGITNEGILEFCFGETANNTPSRYLSVSGPDISEDFVERLIQKCHLESTPKLQLRIDRAHPFDLSACDETAKKTKKSKGNDGKMRTAYEFDGFEICETVNNPGDGLFIWYALELWQ